MRDPFVKLRLSDARVIADAAARPAATYAEELALQRLDYAITTAEKLTARKRARPLPQAHRKPDQLERDRKRHERHGRKARRTMGVYDEVLRRAGGVCECGCGRPFNVGPILDSMPHMDDYFGGAQHRNARECWMIRAECHRDKTANKPSKADWLRKFIAHCRLNGFVQEGLRAQAKLDSGEDIASASDVMQSQGVSRE